jgi:hypothetical protein
MNASAGADKSLKNPCFPDGSVDDIEPSPPNLKASNAVETIKFHANRDFLGLSPRGIRIIGACRSCPASHDRRAAPRLAWMS